MLPVVCHPDYDAGFAAGHRFPMSKYTLLREALERDRNAVVLGNPDGNVTLTEFFDYNCGFCRKMLPTMTKLIEADPNLRVACRELPVFGEGSYFAARAALAVRDMIAAGDRG